MTQTVGGYGFMTQIVGVWIYDPNRRGYGFMTQIVGGYGFMPQTVGVYEFMPQTVGAPGGEPEKEQFVC